MKTLIALTTAATLMGALPAAAKCLSQKAAEAFLHQGTFKAKADSRGSFSKDGTYVFKHKRNTQKGTYFVDPKGRVMFQDGNDTHGFCLDQNAKGKLTLVYTHGKWKGSKFPLR